MKDNTERRSGYRMDYFTMLVPFGAILLMCVSFLTAPEQSKHVLDGIRFVLGDTFGAYYLVIGLGVLLISFYLSFSKIGDIVLGGPNEKPQYSFWLWGAMVFTCGLAADILFYSLCEWIYYAQEPHIAELGTIQDWASAYPIYHWSMIPWSFYAVLAACTRKTGNAIFWQPGFRTSELRGRAHRATPRSFKSSENQAAFSDGEPPLRRYAPTLPISCAVREAVRAVPVHGGEPRLPRNIRRDAIHGVRQGETTSSDLAALGHRSTGLPSPSR